MLTETLNFAPGWLRTGWIGAAGSYHRTACASASVRHQASARPVLQDHGITTGRGSETPSTWSDEDSRAWRTE